MSANTIRNALGVLQDEPDNEQAWTNLRSALGFTSDETSTRSIGPQSAEMGGTELASLLEAARRAHEMRREYEAVADLLEIEVDLAKDRGDREVELAHELARVRDDVLLDDAGALVAYRRVLALRPDDPDALEAIERSEVKRGKWRDLAQKYFTEAKSANDPAFKSSLLVSAAEIAYRYARPELESRAQEAEEEAGDPPSKSKKKGKGKKAAPKEGKDPRRDLVEKIIGLLRDALAADAKNRRALILYERILTSEERWEELATVLDAFAGEVTAKDEKIASLTRLARTTRKKLGATERAMEAYTTILDLSPGHPEATRALVDHFTEKEQWEHLVSLYEGQLSGGGVRPGQEVGVILQIAMVNWKMRGKTDAAEPYFERLRKHEPAHPGMLNFFREWCVQKGEQTRLVQILTDAQRAMPDGPQRANLAGEIATLAEEGANAQKAIEQWRTLLRAQPNNVEARDALKRLYRTTGSYNHLADLLRSELEKVAPDAAAARLPILREIAQIYRENIKSDSALVTVLSQIIALDASDAGAVRELARVYEALGRWRDLLTTQMRLAELEPDQGVKAELYRAAGRRWLEQFSNVQNAVEAFEKLREARPEDREAVEKLKELYGKRRAYRQLYELYDAESKRTSGAERRNLWVEMAKMASDRLDRGVDATRLYKMILAEDPDDASALDALEKQAERDKDYATVAGVLERRVELADDPQARLVILQKLGSVYSDRLQDHTGALRVWRRVLDLSPGHAKALRILRESYLAMSDFDGLTELYASMNDWDGLAEVLSSTADRTTDTQAKVDLSFRVAEIWEEKVNAPERAFRSYERVLSVKPDDRRAAAALVPLYERDEKWARLPALYEVLLAHATDDTERRGLYTKLAQVTGDKLSDKVAAFRHAKKAYELAPTEPGALASLEGWARTSGEWAGLAQAIRARLAVPTASIDERRELRMKLAEVSAIHAGRPDDAVEAYKELIEANPDDEVAVSGLDKLLRSMPDRREDLRWLFRLRVNRAEGRSAVPLLAEWALLEEEAFEGGSARGPETKAVDVYRELLGIDPEHLPSLRALSRLLMNSGDAEGAVATLKRERDLVQGDDRVARELDMARVYIGREQLKNPREALACAQRALEISPHHNEVISLVEELMPLAETRKDAAIVLEQAYAAAGKFEKQGDVLAVLIATAPSKQDRLSLHLRLAAVKQNLGDRTGAFDVLARAALDYPTELDLWDRLAVLANKTSKTQQFVETIAQAVPEKGETGLPPHVEMDLSERAATLYDEMLGEIDRATPYLERILLRDPGNDRAFLRLKQILTTRERWTDLEALYERMLSATESPDRRTDLLAEVAIIAEEITNDTQKATRFYERILEIEPGHEHAIFALDKLYATHERWPSLADLLRRRIELAGSSVSMPLKLRLGTLLFVRLSDPKGALDQLEEFVLAEPANRDGRELVEKCLAHPDLRQRAAIILEGVYSDRDEMRDLVRVLEIRLEFVADDVERRELLRRVAELRDQRLTDDAGSFDTYARLLPLAPGDVEARQRYLEIGTRLGRLAEAADVLEAAAKNADVPQPRAEILGDVAKIYEAANAVDKSEAIHRQVLELAPEDPSIALPAVRALERIYAVSGKNRELLQVLRAQVKLEEHADARRELLGRIGDLAETLLSDDAAAIAAWKERLEDDPADTKALTALDRLYARAGDHRNLVEVLRTRERNADDADQRKVLMGRAAKTLETLGETDEAILAYRAVLDDFGADREIYGSLGALYEKAERWRDLAETLEADLALTNEPTDRIGLLTRLGDVRRKRLGEVPEAIEAYRQALTIEPSTDAARIALEDLLGDENARGEAAEILRPLYESTDTNDKLLRVLDIQIELEGGLDARLELLARAASVAEGPLDDPAKALVYTSRGLREAAGEPVVEEWISRTERLSERTSGWADLVALYRSVASDIVDEDKQVAVHLRIAELARTKLSDAELAKQSYRRALELRPEETRALEALESLHEEAGEQEPLIEILKRRADIAPSDDEKRTILFKMGKVLDQAAGDRDRAIGVYEQILDLGLDETAVQALERLYTAQARWGDLVALHERELGEDVTHAGRRATLHHALGRIYDKELGESDRAFEAFAEALRVEQTHEATVQSLEEIVANRRGERGGDDRTHAARAAEMLEAVYLTRLDWRKVMGAVEARLEGSQDPEERRDLLRRLAKLHEEQEENYRAALDVMAKLLAEDVTDEATWAELERLARVASAEDHLADIFAAELEKITADEPSTARLAYRTGELFERKNAHRALDFYRRAYRFSPEEEQKAFQAIDRLLANEGQAAERVSLYRDALEYRTDPVERVATFHTIAKIEEEQVGDADAAINTLRSVLDVDDADAAALDALGRLYLKRERWRDLADLHRRRAEQSALPEEEAKWRLALADVLDKKLEDALGAIEELETILGLVSPQTSEAGQGAVRTLESMLGREDYRPRVVELLRPIYEQADDWKKLVEVARHRYSIAGSPAEKVSVLRDTAKLLEERGSDQNRAFDCLREAFVIDPDDGEVREELDRLAIATSRWDDLADAYERGIEKIDGVGRRELLEALAKLHDKRRDDPRKALAAWQRLFALDESDSHPLDEMDQLATLLSDWTTLVRVLAKRAELTNDDEERASLWRRIGESRRDMLEDQQGAIDAYERALELEPAGSGTIARTLDNLIPLYEERSDAARLVDLYRRRVELCGEDDGDLKHRILLDAARCYEVGLQDRREAVVLLGQALATKPNDPEVMKRLSDLYEAEKMWPELLDNLRAEADLAVDAPAKIGITKRIGRLYATELDDHEKALDAFREVLASGYDEDAARMVRQIGETRDELRREAAGVLEPVLRTAGKHEELADALEMRLRSETDPLERATTLRTIAKVAEESLSDLARAQGALLRALADQPQDADLHTDVERVSGLLGRDGFARYAEALGERSASIFDAKVTAELFMRLGKVAEAHLSDLAKAAEAFSRAAEQGGDAETVLVALERVHAALGDTRALVDVLERRIAIESDGAAQADLYHRLASLQIGETLGDGSRGPAEGGTRDMLGDKAQGLATLRLALERVPEHARAREAVERLLTDDSLFDDAFDTLEGVYRSTNRGEDLARLYERRVDRADGPRARTRARLELARIRETEANDGPGAQRAVEAAVIGDPTDTEALAELERLAEKNNAWRDAADALSRALEAQERAAPGAGNAELWSRLGAWHRDKVTDARAAEEAYAKALDGDPENIELVRAVESLRRGPGRERDRVATLRRLAKLEGEPEKKRELAKEAAQLAEVSLADAKLAEEVLRELLAENEADGWAAEELTRLREAAGDYEEVVRLLLKRAESAAEGEVASSLRHRAADVAAERLGDRDRAVALYEEIFEQDRRDTRAQERLVALYGELGKYNELARLLMTLIDLAESPEARAKLRFDLARLQLEKFENSGDATDTLRAILEESPDHEEAATLLGAIFEKGEKHADLAELKASLVERARAHGDAALELSRMVELGEILELRLKDERRALDTYDRILGREPHHRGALEAVARLAESREAWDKAEVALARLLETASGTNAVELALRLANVRKQLGDDTGVEDALKRAMTADPSNTDVRERLGQLYERTKKWADLAGLLVSNADMLGGTNGSTTDEVATGSSNAPPSPVVTQQVELLRRAAEIHLRERKAPSDAVPVLERVMTLVPGDRELMLLLCDAYSSSQRERDAAVVLERIIASFGNKRTKELSLYHHRLGRALAALGDKDVALSQLDMAFKIDPGSVEVLRDLGVLALETNDLDRAQKTFRALLLQRLDAQSGISKGEVFYYLGEISMKQGDKPKAIQMLERAVENEPSLDRAKVMLTTLKN
jgi:golgin subfamily B member 1